MLAVNMVFSKNDIIAVETKYVIIAIVRYRVLQILMVVVTCKSRQRIKRRTPFLVISYQSSPSPSHRQTESNLSNYPRVRTSSYFQWVLILKIPSLNSLFKLWLFLKVFFAYTMFVIFFTLARISAQIAQMCKSTFLLATFLYLPYAEIVSKDFKLLP